MVEEPPSRALFLIVAHQPGRLLPTIRSRCRKLMLKTLHAPDIVRAIEAQGELSAGRAPAEIEKAAAHADGSVREALRILARQGAASAKMTDDLLRNLPKIDWGGVRISSTRSPGRKPPTNSTRSSRPCSCSSTSG